MTTQPMTLDFPLHVKVALALEPGIEVRLIPGPQNIGRISDGAAFPIPGGTPDLVWAIVRKSDLGIGHDCPYAWDNEPCECRTEWFQQVPLYHHDWAATGPIITKGTIDLSWKPDSEVGSPDCFAEIGYRLGSQRFIYHGEGSDPLMATCSLILALAASENDLHIRLFRQALRG